jgi:hypothetical protein
MLVRLSALSAIAMEAFLIACSICTNDFVAEYRSPGGRWAAVVFSRGCGATVGFNTQISLIPSKSTLPDQAGNVFIADDNHGASRLTTSHTLPLEITWKSEDSLIIRYPQGARIFKSEQKFGPVSITFCPSLRGQPCEVKVSAGKTELTILQQRERTAPNNKRVWRGEWSYDPDTGLTRMDHRRSDLLEREQAEAGCVSI